MSVLEQLQQIPGVAPRAVQLHAAELIDHTPDRHVCLEAPTGVGKSIIAYAAARENGGTIVTHSNGLAMQYVHWLQEHGESDVRWAFLAGASHYWCPRSTPYSSLPDEAKDAVDSAGCFIGSGLLPADYKRWSLAAIKTDSSNPCRDCEVRAEGACPLWQARDAAVAADVVVTNAALLAIGVRCAAGEPPADDPEFDPDDAGIDGQWAEEAQAPWPALLLRDRLIIDEADSCEGMIRDILVPSLTIAAGRRRITPEDAETAAVGVKSAMLIVNGWAEGGEHPMRDQAQRFVAGLRDRTPEFETESWQFQGKVYHRTVLRLPNKMDRWWEPYDVLAMSATLTMMQARWLGLKPTVVHPLPGLDLSNCHVITHRGAPKWSYQAPDKWADYVAGIIAQRSREGKTAGLFQSRRDLDTVATILQMDMGIEVLHYLSDRDRPTIISTFKQVDHPAVLLGCFAGAGRGVDLPGDLLENVVISRVPQHPPIGLKSQLAKLRWLQDSNAAVIQAVGRVCRHDGDRGRVDIIGGFGGRMDIRDRLLARGWNLNEFLEVGI